MDAGIEPFHLIERGTNLLAGQPRMVDEVDEILDRLLEIDVVFPERVVAIEDQDLGGAHRPA